MTERTKAHRQAGFTLIELMVTLAVLGLLASIALPVAQVASQRSQEAELRRALHEIRHALDAYHQASEDGRIPKEATNSSGYPPNLDILVEGVADQRDPKEHKIYFLRRIPRNPLVGDPALADAETWATRSYASEASDPQPGDDVYDVFAASTRIGLNGVPYNKW